VLCDVTAAVAAGLLALLTCVGCKVGVAVDSDEDKVGKLLMNEDSNAVVTKLEHVGVTEAHRVCDQVGGGEGTGILCEGELDASTVRVCKLDAGAVLAAVDDREAVLDAEGELYGDGSEETDNVAPDDAIPVLEAEPLRVTDLLMVVVGVSLAAGEAVLLMLVLIDRVTAGLGEGEGQYKPAAKLILKSYVVDELGFQITRYSSCMTQPMEKARAKWRTADVITKPVQLGSLYSSRLHLL
jgi:hypothetical protein